MTYDSTHSPCEHFARVGYEHLAERFALPDDWNPDEDDARIVESQMTDRFVLSVIRGERRRGRKPKVPREEKREQDHEFAGIKIDWPAFLPELKTWAGQATVATLVASRQEALHESDLPDDVRLVDWRVPLKGCSGLDARTAPNALDDGFSVAAQDMAVYTYAAAELLALVGLQISPVTRLGRKEYAYRDCLGGWWKFRVVQREGYHRVVTMAERFEWPLRWATTG